MTDLSKDPIFNVINDGIRRDIRIAIENECYRAALILVFSSIDAMAHLSRPEAELYNRPEDFMNWVDRYLDLGGTTKISKEEWWAARNAIVHTYTAYSRRHEKPNVRIIGYTVGVKPFVSYNERVDRKLVLVDILGLKDAFFAGMERFLIDGFSNEKTRPLLEKRFREMFHVLPFSGE